MDPDDLPALARAYADDASAPALRRQALAHLLDAHHAGPRTAEAAALLAEVLAPLVRSVAVRVARNAPRDVREDFIDAALGLVLAPRENAPARLCAYRPEVGPLENWLFGVLRNCWRNDRRRDSPHQRLAGVEADDRPAETQGGRDADMDLVTPFSAADLRRVEAWGPLPRVELLVMAGLWPKAPPERWAAWLGDYENARQITLPRPLPPERFLYLDTPQERTGPLAELLGYRANTLTQRWRRGRPLLEALDFIREVQDV